jgi:histidine triad (HIT) family protein
MSDCLFCKIVSGDIPAKIIAQTDTLMAFNDINPQAPQHILIIPKKHVESMRDLKPDQVHLLGEMALMAQELTESQDFRTVLNTGAGAGQTVFHMHMHILSGRNFGWPPG